MRTSAGRRCAMIAMMIVAGCGGDGDGDDALAGPLDDFRVTAPDGFAEIAPNEAAEIAWDVTASDAYGLEVGVVGAGGAQVVIDQRVLAPGSVSWRGRDLAGATVPPGNYRVYASALGPDDGAVQTVDGGATHLVVVQGVRFRDATLAWTGADATREMVISTVTRSTMALTLLLDVDPDTTGDERVLLRASIPGELVPVARSYPFTGRDADGVAIPGGTYTLAAVIAARDGAITYRVDGPTLTWTP